MRSRWLDWSPGDRIIERFAGAAPTKPSQPGFVGFAGQISAGFSITQGSDADYHDRVEAALQVICQPDYPAGMLRWLETSNPTLYEELTSHLPDLIHRLWSAHAPLEEFQQVVDAWLATHNRACEVYREHLRRSET